MSSVEEKPVTKQVKKMLDLAFWYEKQAARAQSMGGWVEQTGQHSD